MVDRPKPTPPPTHAIGPKGRTRLTHAQRLLLFFAANPGMGDKEAAEALGIPEAKAAQLADKLVARGLLKRAGRVALS